MNFKDLQEMILKKIDYKLSPLLSAELHSLQSEGKPWGLAVVGRMATELKVTPTSKVLALVTNNLYGDFLDDSKLPQKDDVGKEREWIQKKLKDAGWKRPFNNFADLCEAAELLGVGVDYVYAFLAWERSDELVVEAFKFLGDPTKEAA